METTVGAFMATARAVADYATGTPSIGGTTDTVAGPGAARSAGSTTGAPWAALTDAGLIGVQKAIAAHERQFDALKTQAAGELARRELGHAGLAAREGFRSPEAMLAAITGATGREAAQLVTLGRITGEAEAVQSLLDEGTTDIGGQPVVLPWEAPITAAVAAGELSVEQAESIRRGLGTPTGQVTADQLRDEAVTLITEHHAMPADQLYREARIARDLLDEEGIPAREAELYAARSLKLRKLGNGMLHANWDLDPQGAALLTAVIGPLTSPRTGGPRMIDPAEKQRAQSILDDPRSTEQIASDGLLALLSLGVNVAPEKMYGKIVPVVKIVVTQDSLDSGKGFAVIEGNPAPVSIATAQRLICTGATQDVVTTPTGGPLDLGRTKRLFDKRQHDALAVRDGGCMWPDCNFEPVRTEAHHINEYERDHGNTDIADGILLCTFHHLLLHNNGWRITRTGEHYALIPPATLDREQTPIPLKSKSLLITKLRRRKTG